METLNGPVIVCMPASIVEVRIEGWMVEACDRCTEPIVTTPGTERLSVSIGGASKLCVHCAAELNRHGAREIYRALYGPADDEFFEHPSDLRARGPRCCHMGKDWVPMLTLNFGNRRVGEALVPATYCEECTHELDSSHFASYVTICMPGATGQLKWVRKSQAAAMILPKPRERALPIGRG